MTMMMCLLLPNPSCAASGLSRYSFEKGKFEFSPTMVYVIKAGANDNEARPLENLFLPVYLEQ